MLLALLQVATLVVGGVEAPTLAEALRVAPAGSRIVVPTGIYHATMLRVDRPLELVGQGWPVVDGEGRGGSFMSRPPGSRSADS
jgi:nitrous oxidase accessory protein NosD